MTPKDLFDYSDRVLQDLTGNHGVPFGGKVVILLGDFRQTLPIVKRGLRLLGRRPLVEPACWQLAGRSKANAAPPGLTSPSPALTAHPLR